MEPFLPRTASVSWNNLAASVMAKKSEEADKQSASQAMAPAIHCTLLCQPLVEHDFSARGLCRIAVGLEISHSQDVEELVIRSYAGGMSTPSEFQQFYRGYPLLIWSTSCRRLRLSIDQTASQHGLVRRVDLVAVVAVPGIYDVSSLKLSYRRKDSPWEDATPLQSQFLTVIQAAAYTQLRGSQDASFSIRS